jgi:hypothetical protein
MAQYSPEFLAALRRYYERSHYSERAIARLFELAASTVRRIASQEGWVRPPVPIRDLEPAMRLLEQAMALESADPHRAPVADPHSELALRVPMLGFTPDLLDAMRRRYENSRQSKRSIAHDYGVSDRSLRRIATREGWLRPHEGGRDVLPSDRLLAQAIALERRVFGRTRG